MATPHERNLEQVSQAELLAEAAEAAPTRHASLWGDAWRRLVRNRLAVLGLVIVIILSLTAIFAPLIAPYGEDEVVAVQRKPMKPSWNFPMGIDQNGRDVFSRIVYG